MDYLYISLLWIGYCALHSFLISITFTQYLIRILGRYYAFYRLFYVIISVYLLVILINFSNQLSTPVIFNYSTPWNVVRHALLILSLVIFLWAFIFSYDPLSFFGIRQIINLKGNKDEGNKQISKQGLLAYMRHPMYFALILFLWCTTFTLLDIAVNSILTIYVLIGTVLEERKLILEFGGQYKDYQQEVPMIIPFTKRKKYLTTHTR